MLGAKGARTSPGKQGGVCNSPLQALQIAYAMCMASGPRMRPSVQFQLNFEAAARKKDYNCCIHDNFRGEQPVRDLHQPHIPLTQPLITTGPAETGQPQNVSTKALSSIKPYILQSWPECYSGKECTLPCAPTGQEDTGLHLVGRMFGVRLTW